jgi:hypothetical protein
LAGASRPTGDDELLISTMGARARTKAVVRTGKVSLCILDERWPFAYLQVDVAENAISRSRDSKP